MGGYFTSNQQFLEKLTERIESNLTNEQFGVTELARQMGMSRSNLHLRVKKMTGTSVSQYVNQIRLKYAIELLKTNSRTISEIAFDCGFRSVSYFTKCFHEFYGLTPGDWIKNTNEEEFPKPKRENSRLKRSVTNTLRGLILIVSSAIIVYTIADNFIFEPISNKNEKSIAVMPFKNLNNDSEYNYFSEGIVEAINRYLFQLHDLNVISLSSAKNYINSDLSAREIGEELKVSKLLEGTIQRDENQIRIEVKLVDTDTERHIWAENYDTELKDIFRTQSQIAEKVALALKNTLSIEDKTVLQKRMTTNARAYDFYLKGMHENRTYSRSGNRRALSFFQQAISLDSNFSLPYTGKAVSYMAKAAIFDAEISAQEAFKQAKPFIDKALMLQPELPEAHTWKGFYMLYNNWDFKSAEEEYLKAIDSDFPDALAVYADFLNFIRRHDEALEISQRLDQNHPFFPNSRMVLSLFYLGRYEEAEEFCQLRMRTFNNFYTLNNHGFLKLNTGKYEEAISIFQRIFELENVRYPRILGWLGAAYAKSGQEEKAFQLIEELKEASLKSNAGSPDFFTAVIQVSLGHKEAALKSLKKAIEKHEMEIPWLISEPQLYSLHDEPEFKKMVKTVGFPDWKLNE